MFTQRIVRLLHSKRGSRGTRVWCRNKTRQWNKLVPDIMNVGIVKKKKKGCEKCTHDAVEPKIKTDTLEASEAADDATQSRLNYDATTPVSLGVGRAH